VRITYGAGMNCAAQHSQAVYAMLTSIPGLKVVMPTTPADAKGLLTAAIRGDDPVMFFEHKTLYGESGEVPDGDHILPFGHARLVREGRDATIVTCGQLVNFAAAAADRLAKDGIACDVIDLRTTSPLDEEAILDSVEMTGRLIVADESPPRCSLASDIAGLVASQAFASLRAPVELVTAPHSPVPFARELESAYLPSSAKIEAAVRKSLAYR
jgi:pyruvate/2-oxoglutarate/acetoin dehydrogenase E1 component